MRYFPVLAVALAASFAPTVAVPVDPSWVAPPPSSPTRPDCTAVADYPFDLPPLGCVRPTGKARDR